MAQIQLTTGDITINKKIIRKVSQNIPETKDISQFLGHLFQNLCAEILGAEQLSNHGEAPDLYLQKGKKIEYFEAKFNHKNSGSMIKKGQLDSHLENYPRCNYVLGYYSRVEPAKTYSFLLQRSIEERVELFLPHSLYILPGERVREWYINSPLKEKGKLGVSRDVVKNLRENDLITNLISYDITKKIIG